MQTTGEDAGTPAALDAAAPRAAAGSAGVRPPQVSIPPDPGPAAFRSSRICRFDTTVKGASVAGDVSDVPVLIRLTDPAVIDAVRPGAPDVRLYDPDGTPLSYEIERWDSSTDQAAIWVKVPTVDGNSATDYVILRFDDVGDEEDGQDSAGTFSNGFHAVWHLNESPADGAWTFRDSTGHGFQGTAQASMDASNRITGVAGYAIELDGSPQHVSLTALGDLGSRARTESVTTELWLKSYRVDDPTPGTLLGVVNAENDWTRFKVSINEALPFNAELPGVVHAALCDVTSETWLRGTSAEPLPQLNDAQWHHVTVVTEPSSPRIRIFVDGELQTTTYGNRMALRPMRDFVRPLLLGALNWQGSLRWFFLGAFDEVRMSTPARSADWVKLSYENQRARQTLVRCEAP